MNSSTIGNILLGALIGALPTVALFAGLSIMSVEVQDTSCDSPSIGSVSIMDLAFSRAFFTVDSEVCIPPHLLDLYENMRFICYVAVVFAVVHITGSALLIMNGKQRLVGAGLLGSLLGEIGVFSALSPAFNRHCDYWLVGCSGDVAALFGGLLLMASGGALGALTGFLIAHGKETCQHDAAIGFAEMVKQAWSKLWKLGVAKGALIGVAPGLSLATLLFTSGVFILQSEPYASFYGETTLSCAVFLLSIASLGGQVGAIIGWLHRRRTREKSG